MDEAISICLLTDDIKKEQGGFTSPFYITFVNLLLKYYFDIKLVKEKYKNTWNRMTKYEKEKLEEIINVGY